MSTYFRSLLLACVVGAFTGSAYAVDGVILIDQAHALKGNVTPGDPPGFPVVLFQSGSYRLSGNLTVPDKDTPAIFIAAPSVTIDLNGFSILGPNVCTGNPPDTVVACTLSGGGHGISIAGSGNKRVHIFNGTISGMGGGGIVTRIDGVSTLVDHVIVDNCASGGIEIFGTVSDVFVSLNGSGGIIANNVKDSTITQNASNGVEVFDGVASGNSITHNVQIGLLGVGSVLTNNLVSANGFGGISAQCPGTAIIGNAVTGNAFAQIGATAPCLVLNNAP